MPKCIERWLRANGSRHISTIRYLHWANTFATEPYLNTFSMCRRARGVQQKAKIEKPFFLENGCILCRWRVECREFDAANNKNGWCSYTIYQRTNYVFGVHWYIGGVCSAFFFVGCVAMLPSASHFVSFFRFHWNFAIVTRMLWTPCVRHPRTSTSAQHTRNICEIFHFELSVEVKYFPLAMSNCQPSSHFSHPTASFRLPKVQNLRAFVRLSQI